MKTETRKGRLVYEEAPAVMTMTAYLHNEFKLVLDDGSSMGLVPSKSVSSDELKKHHDKKVELSVVKLEPKSAGREAAPLGPDGKPLQRPARFEVLSLRAL